MSKNGRFFKPRIRHYWHIGLSWGGSSQKTRDAGAKATFYTETESSNNVKPSQFEQISFLSGSEFGVVKKYDNVDLSNSLSDYWQGK